MDKLEFQPFPKMPRLSREVFVTEKIDGTNAQVFITEDGLIFAGSRNRWLTPEKDNYGFCQWVNQNKEELLKLGPGRHFGEWWGLGIQRGYGLSERCFSLFNVSRWLPLEFGGVFDSKLAQPGPNCCRVVPTIWRGEFDLFDFEMFKHMMESHGSFAAPGFRAPEGIVIYHTAAGIYFKKTLMDDEKPKGLSSPPTPSQMANGVEAAKEIFNQSI